MCFQWISQNAMNNRQCLIRFYSIWGTLVMLSPCTGEYMSNFLTRSTSGSMFESVAGNHEASPCIQWGTCLTLLVRIQLMKKILEGFSLGWTWIMWLESNVDKQISVFPHLWCVSGARTCSKISLRRWLKVTLKWKSTLSVFYMCITYLTCVTCPVCMPPISYTCRTEPHTDEFLLFFTKMSSRAKGLYCAIPPSRIFFHETSISCQCVCNLQHQTDPTRYSTPASTNFTVVHFPSELLPCWLHY